MSSELIERLRGARFRIQRHHDFLDPLHEEAAAALEASLAREERLRSALEAMQRVVTDSQDVLSRYIVPDCTDDPEDIINELYGILDGSKWRNARDKARAALSHESER